MAGYGRKSSLDKETRARVLLTVLFLTVEAL